MREREKRKRERGKSDTHWKRFSRHEHMNSITKLWFLSLKPRKKEEYKKEKNVQQLFLHPLLLHSKTAIERLRCTNNSKNVRRRHPTTAYNSNPRRQDSRSSKTNQRRKKPIPKKVEQKEPITYRRAREKKKGEEREALLNSTTLNLATSLSSLSLLLRLLLLLQVRWSALAEREEEKEAGWKEASSCSFFTNRRSSSVDTADWLQEELALARARLFWL